MRKDSYRNKLTKINFLSTNSVFNIYLMKIKLIHYGS